MISKKSDGLAAEAVATLSEHQAINHEFINSLASVRSLSELLVAYPGLDAGDRIRFLTMIHAETERQIRLLSRLNGIAGRG